MAAILGYDSGAARALLRRGADPHAVDRYGTTPLYHASVHGAAACWGHTDVVPELLSHGADPNLHEDQGTGYSPLEWALRYGHTETADLLRASGAR
jgi:ankyrin repeat protein